MDRMTMRAADGAHARRPVSAARGAATHARAAPGWPLPDHWRAVGNQALQRAFRPGARPPSAALLAGMPPGNQARQRLARGARPGAPPTLQRTIGDGHDLSATRFAGDTVLEACFDGERVLKKGASGPAVTAVQQALVDLGFPLPTFGIDGAFGKETKKVVKDLQRASGLSGKDVDGKIGPKTMALLDTRSGGGTGPPPGPGPGPGPKPGPDLMGLSITLPDHITGDRSPGGMPDRIPPRVDTQVAVTVSGFEPGMRPITLLVGSTSGNPDDGSALIDGLAATEVTGSTTVQLRGDDQTRPGRGGRLQLIAQQGTTVLATSRGFSVAAIPHTFSTTFLARVTDPAKRGIEVSFGWQSDSGQVGDLDEVTMAEEIEDTLVSGCFVGNSGNVAPRPPIAATAPPLKDTHSSRVATMTREGRQVTRQVARFDDKRSGGAGLPVPNSGYEISRRVDDLPFGLGRLFTITKEGQATTANGIASAAGVGSITRIQSV